MSNQRHHLTHAGRLHYGGGYHEGMHKANERKGVPFQPITKFEIGTPVAATNTYLVNAATGANQMPGTGGNRISLLAANDGTDPLDAATRAAVLTIGATNERRWNLGVARNIVAVAAGLPAGTLTVEIWGYDTWGDDMHEVLTFTGNGTQNGRKAFLHVDRIDLVSTVNMEAGNLSVGTGDVLGLPYRLTDLTNILSFYARGTVTADETFTANYQIGDATNPATNATGDVRGTVDPASTPNGATAYVMWAYVDRPEDRNAIAGVEQFKRSRTNP